MVTLALTLLAGMALVSVGVGAVAAGVRKSGKIQIAETVLGNALDWVKVVTEAALDVIPDTAVVRLDLCVMAPTLARAHDSVRQQLEDVRELLRNTGIAPERVRMDTYRLEDGGERGEPYRVGSALRVELTDFRQIKSLLQQVAVRGWATLREVSFTVRRREEANHLLVAEAFRTARLEAEKLAQDAGRRLGRLKSAAVHFNDGGQGGEFPAQPPDFTPDHIRVSARIEAQYSTEERGVSADSMAC